MNKPYFERDLLYRSKPKNPLRFETETFSLALYYVSHSIKKDSPYSQKRLHRHSYYELQLILNGYSEYILADGRKISLKPNQFILFPPAFKHYIYHESADFEKLYIEFEVEFKDSSIQGIYTDTNLINAFDANEEIIHSTNKLIKLYKENSPELPVRAFFIFLDMFMEISKSISSTHIFTPALKYTDDRISDALNYINDNISANLTVKKVADHVHLSPKQLTRIFEKVINTSPGTYIKDCRIKRIQNLLGNPDLSIKAIADMMEYKDVSSLTRAYKKITDNTPHVSRKYMFEP